MRATLHVLPAAGLGTWIAGLRVWKPGGWPIKNVDAVPLARHIDKALRGKVMTKKELATAVAKLGATPKMVEGLLGSWSSSLRYASFIGCLCFAPSEGQEPRFTHPATWLRKPPANVDDDKAFDALTTKFLRAYGPATPLDLGPRWWGINQGMAKRRLAAIADSTTRVMIEDKPYWMLTRDVAELAATKPADVVRLLPAFDQWVVGASRVVPAFLDPKYRRRIYRLQGWVSPTLLVNGRIAGTWNHERKGRTLSVVVAPFTGLPRWTRAHIGAEAERLATFLGGDLKLTIAIEA